MTYFYEHKLISNLITDAQRTLMAATVANGELYNRIVSSCKSAQNCLKSCSFCWYSPLTISNPAEKVLGQA